MSKRDNLVFGKNSQDIIKECLRNNGYVVYAIDDNTDWYVSGDFILASPDGVVAFGDAKGKTQSTYYRIGDVEEHGIDYNTWQRYLSICEFRNLAHAHIAVYERTREMDAFGKEEGRLRPSNVVLLYNLFSPYRENTTTANYGKGGMVYWKRDEHIEKWKIVPAEAT